MKSMRARLIRGLLAASTLLLSGCSAITLANDWLVPSNGFVAVSDVPYGQAERQRLDIYRPASDGGDTVTATEEKEVEIGGHLRRPVVVFIYGGSWKSGRRSYYRFIGEAFTRAGFVTVIPDYRVYPEVTFPTFVADAALALQWTQAHIADYGGNPDDMVLIGHSAGAHIAALLSTDKRYLSAVNVPPHSIRGFVGLAGPYAFDPSAYRSTREAFGKLADPSICQPITFVDGTEPPMLLLHGADDQTVLPTNAYALADRVRAAGGSAVVIEYPDLGHIGIILALFRRLQGETIALNDTVRFIHNVTSQPAHTDHRTTNTDRGVQRPNLNPLVP